MPSREFPARCLPPPSALAFARGPIGPLAAGPLLALALTLTLTLTGCDTLPGAPGAHPPSSAASAPEVPPAAPGPASAPAAATTPPSLAMREQAQRIALGVMELLDTGHEEQARDELAKALALDPSNRLAQKLLHQVSVDPVAELGRESFAYRVQPNDSLSKIAGRFLGDVQSFYLLARYNDIKVPRQVAEGQLIRVPGKAPARVEVARAEPAPGPSPAAAPSPPVAAPPSAPATATPSAPTAAPPAPETPAQLAWRKAQAAERGGDLPTAYEQYRVAAAAEHPGASTRAADVGHRLAARYATEARLAYSNKDLPGALRSWDKVLAIEPDNASARLERARAADLYEKYKKL